MLEARFKEAQMMKRLVDAIKELVTDANFDCDDEGIHLQAMDNSHVALVAVNLKTEGFTLFRCDRPVTLGVNIASFTKVLKCAKDDDEITLSASDNDVLRLQYLAKANDRVAEYEIKLMDIEQETLGIPETDYDAHVNMSSTEFARICRDLSALGESVRIEVTKEGVKFSSEGDSANGMVLVKPSEKGVRPIEENGGSSSKKTKVKKEVEDEPMLDDNEQSEDDGGGKEAESGEEEEEEEEQDQTSRKRKRAKEASKGSSKSKKRKSKDDDDDDDGVEGVTIAMNQHVNLTFSLKYLANFAKSSTLCNRVRLSMSNEVPLLVAYDFGQGTVQYYLAPKIGDE